MAMQQLLCRHAAIALSRRSNELCMQTDTKINGVIINDYGYEGFLMSKELRSEGVSSLEEKCSCNSWLRIILSVLSV